MFLLSGIFLTAFSRARLNRTGYSALPGLGPVLNSNIVKNNSHKKRAIQYRIVHQTSGLVSLICRVWQNVSRFFAVDAIDGLFGAHKNSILRYSLYSQYFSISTFETLRTSIDRRLNCQINRNVKTSRQQFYSHEHMSNANMLQKVLNQDWWN